MRRNFRMPESGAGCGMSTSGTARLNDGASLPVETRSHDFSVLLSLTLAPVNHSLLQGWKICNSKLAAYLFCSLLSVLVADL